MFPGRFDAVCLLSLAGWGAGCRPSQAAETPVAVASASVEDPADAQLARGWHYTARVSEDLANIDVELCFTGAVGPRLVASNSSAADYIYDVRVVESGARIARTGRTFSLADVESGDCVGYRVSLTEMAQGEGFSRNVHAEGDSIALRQSMWLWYAREKEGQLPRDLPLSLTLELPQGVEASVPWSVQTGERREARTTDYDLDTTALWWVGYTAFGTLNLQRFEAAGTQIEIAVLDVPTQVSDVGLKRWGTDAAESSALLFGRFPREHLQMLVLPVSGGGGPVHFGMAGRGGGAGVYLMLSSEATDSQLPGGWTTVHELLHHGMPFINEPWMAEGWVSYYTELQRTRMGHRSEKRGWQALLEAFSRGARTRRSGTLAEVSARMHSNFGYQRVYWGGAAIAFFTDIALRQDSGGETTLDDAMVELRRCCGEALHKWPADELLAKLDAWYGKPLFSQTAETYLQQEGFPAVESGFAALGVRVVDGRVVLDDAHPMADQRRQIMAPQ